MTILSSIIFIIVTIVNIGIPFLSLYRIAFNKGTNLCYRLSSLLMWVLIAMFILTVNNDDVTHFFGKIGCYFYYLLFFSLFILSSLRFALKLKRLPFFPKKKFRAWFTLTLSVGMVFLISIGFAKFKIFLKHARKHPKNTIELQFPMQQGAYLIVKGGSASSLNHHFSVKAQRYALDIVKVNRLNLKAIGLNPKGLEEYRIFGDSVYSPCSGEVISLENTIEDNIPPKTNEDKIAGNHVVVFCKGHSIIMAHFKKGSVPVSVGDQVKVGTFIGQVGNSGNTTEPHLHIHAVKGRKLEMIELTGKAEGVPMIFNSKFLIGGDKVVL